MYAQPQPNKCCIFKGSCTIYINEKFLWWAGIHKTLHKHAFQNGKTLGVLNSYNHQTLLATENT